MGRKPTTVQFYAHTSALDMYYVQWENGEMGCYSFSAPFRSGGGDREWGPVKTIHPLPHYVEVGVLKTCSFAHLSKPAQRDYFLKYGDRRGEKA